MKKTVLLFVLGIGLISRLCASQYGVVAHIGQPSENHLAEAEFKLFNEIGIDWVRCDFDWSGVNPERGKWDFRHLDRIVELAEKYNIKILPILDYDVAWYRPSHKHIDAWVDYVRRIVTRYGKKLRYWEVYNEPNLEHFWRTTPSGTEYAEFLKRTYETIKAIDPEIKVLYGGTSRIPLKFIEESYKAGAGKYFDIMCIHPYRWSDQPETLLPELQALHKLMAQYQISQPLWVTEMGYSTVLPPFYTEVLPAAFRRLNITPENTTIGIVSDADFGYAAANRDFDPELYFSDFREIKYLTLPQLHRLDPKKVPVLIPTAGGALPRQMIDDLYSYVKKGGTLIFPARIPLWYLLDKQPDGRLKTQTVFGELYKKFHMGYIHHYWKKTEKWQKPAKEFADEIEFKTPYPFLGIFLTAENLQQGDTFTPIIEGGMDDGNYAIAALYRFNSSLKGNIIASTLTSQTVPPDKQAELLPRSYLLLQACGVKKVFTYCFQSTERKAWDIESYFGIVDRELKPQKSFYAYKMMTAHCPPGSSSPVLTNTDVCYIAHWRKPDQTPVWAIWTEQYPKRLKLNIKGKVISAVNHIGEKVDLTDKYVVSPSVTYIVGPSSVSIK